MRKIFTKLRQALFVLTVLALPMFMLKTRIYAQTDLSVGRVSLTFDDGFESTYTNVLPILSAKGIKGTAFITTSYIGQPGSMTWDQVRELQNSYGWEIGNHTLTHAELPIVTTTQMLNEINQSKSILESQGLNITSFASPFGAHNNAVLAEIDKTHNLHRGFWERDYMNTYPYDKTVLAVESVESTTTVAQVKSWIDQAKANNEWLILVFHEVLPTLDPLYPYITTTDDFNQMVNYISSSGINTVLPNHTLEKPGTNLFTNESFNSGISNGWTTNNASMISLDSLNNGRYPSPAKSILATASSSSSYLFSNNIDAVPSATYLFEAFVNADPLTAGEVGFYVDEYDANGSWISGKWLGAVYPDTVTDFSANYTPSSNSVKKFSLQTYLDGGSQGKVYLDKYEIYNMSRDNTPPPPPPPTPTGTNLVNNGSFESLTSGWANNWTKDSGQFAIDTSSHGDAGSNSLSISNNSTYSHVFSEMIPVDSTKSYSWQQYVNLQYTSGEFGFYIDEYDASGNWISGQWKGLIGSTFSGNKSISYTPTNSNVNKIGLQYYVTPGSNLTLYIDSVKLIAQ